MFHSKLRSQEDKVGIFIMEMANYILSILKTAPQICMSWGMCQARAYRKDGMEGLLFRVSGFKHCGFVAVLYNEGADCFEIELQDGSEAVESRETDVYFDELVDRIDRLVEKTAHYDRDIESWVRMADSAPDKQAAKDLCRALLELREEGVDGEIYVVE